MPALNSRLNARNANGNSRPGRSLKDHINFGNTFAVVMGFLAVKERWEAYKDRQEDSARHGAPQLHRDAAGVLSNPPPYRDDPSADDIGLDADAQTHLLGEDEAPVPPRRRKKRSCCVCCGIRCDLVFKALGIVSALYLFYGIYKVVRWATRSSPTGLEDMPQYSTSLGCSDAPFVRTFKGLTAIENVANLTLDLMGGAVGTVFLTHSNTQSVIVDVDIRTDEKSLLEKVSPILSQGTPVPATLVSLTTPSTASSPDACMRFDLTVHIPSSLKALSVKSQSLVQVKYDEAVPIALSDLVVQLLSPMPNNLILLHDQLTAERATLSMRGGYVVGSLAFVETADVVTSDGSAITNLKVAPLPAPASAPNSPARLVTKSGAGRADIIYSNPNRRIIASEHSSSVSLGDIYLTYKQAGYNGLVDLKARSWTSSGLQGAIVGGPPNRGANELPWVGDKDGPDFMKVESSGWVGLYF